MLTFSQVLQSVPQLAVNLVERAVAVAAPAELLLLHAAADLVDNLGAELDDVEGVEHLHGVGQTVAQGVGVATDRVQRCRLDVRPELGLPGVEPAGVGGIGPAQDQVEQMCPDLPVRVAGQVDHAGDLAALPELAWPPHVFVNAERLHLAQPGGIVGSALGLDLEGVPQPVPGDVEPAVERGHSRVVVAQRVRRPEHCPAGQERPRRQQLMRLGERHHRAGRSSAPPPPLAPGDRTRRFLNGASCRRCSRRPCGTASTPHR